MTSHHADIYQSCEIICRDKPNNMEMDQQPTFFLFILLLLNLAELLNTKELIELVEDKLTQRGLCLRSNRLDVREREALYKVRGSAGVKQRTVR